MLILTYRSVSIRTLTNKTTSPVSLIFLITITLLMRNMMKYLADAAQSNRHDTIEDFTSACVLVATDVCLHFSTSLSAALQYVPLSLRQLRYSFVYPNKFTQPTYQLTHTLDVIILLLLPTLRVFAGKKTNDASPTSSNRCCII